MQASKKATVEKDMAAVLEHIEPMEQDVHVNKHAITLEEYDKMCEAGVFDHDIHIELFRGEIIDMPPPGPEHEYSVGYLHMVFSQAVGQKAYLWPQGNSIGLPQSKSRPQPDITILKWRDDLYKGKRPGPEDVILVVEVSMSTVRFDKKGKLELYAEARIPEYWIVNLVESGVEVYTQPVSGKYESVKVSKRGETVPLPGGLEGNIRVDDLLG